MSLYPIASNASANSPPDIPLSQPCQNLGLWTVPPEHIDDNPNHATGPPSAFPVVDLSEKDMAIHYPPQDLAEGIRQDYYDRHSSSSGSVAIPPGHSHHQIRHPLPPLQTFDLSEQCVNVHKQSLIRQGNTSHAYPNPQMHFQSPESCIASPSSSIESPYTIHSATSGMVSTPTSSSVSSDAPQDMYGPEMNLMGIYNSAEQMTYSPPELYSSASPCVPAVYHTPQDRRIQEQGSEGESDGSPRDMDSPGNQDLDEPKKKNSRRIWTHALEKYLFTSHEIATLGSPHRRAIYMVSLEAHIDRLHSQLLGLNLYPIPIEDLRPYKGLNCKTAKGMVAGFQHDIAAAQMHLLEIVQATKNARNIALARQQRQDHIIGERKFSL